MKRIWWHLSGRFCEARADRAFQNYLKLKAKAEKYFRKLGD